MTKTLPQKLEYAIVRGIIRFSGYWQSPWPGWRQLIKEAVPDGFEDDELRAAFRRLRRNGFIDLFKRGPMPSEVHDYSESSASDDAFFHGGPFDAKITDDGRSHWADLQRTTGRGVFISHIAQEKPVALESLPQEM